MKTNRLYVETMDEEAFIHLEDISLEIALSEDDPDSYFRVSFWKSYLDVAIGAISWLEFGDIGENRKDDFLKILGVLWMAEMVDLYKKEILVSELVKFLKSGAPWRNNEGKRVITLERIAREIERSFFPIEKREGQQWLSSFLT